MMQITKLIVIYIFFKEGLLVNGTTSICIQNAVNVIVSVILSQKGNETRIGFALILYLKY